MAILALVIAGCSKQAQRKPTVVDGKRAVSDAETGIDVMAKTDDVLDEHVRLRFDDGPVQSKEWHVGGKFLMR